MTLPRTVKAVVFDMDGLLVDTERLYTDSLVAVALRDRLHLPQPVILRMIGHTWAGSSEVLRAHFGAAFDTEAFRVSVVEHFYETAQAGIDLKAGVLELLDHLDAVGLPRAIATSSRQADVAHHMGAHGLLERFHTVVAQGDYVRGKPYPDPYLKAAERLGVAPGDCLALEDSHNGVRAAHAAGMMTIMVPDMLDPTEEMHDLWVRIAADLHEVRDLLNGAPYPSIG